MPLAHFTYWLIKCKNKNYPFAILEKLLISDVIKKNLLKTGIFGFLSHDGSSLALAQQFRMILDVALHYLVSERKLGIFFKTKPPARRSYAPEGKAKIITTGIHWSISRIII